MRFLLVATLVFSQISARTQSRVDTALYAILPYDDRAKMCMDWQFPNARPDTMTQATVDSAERYVDSAYAAYIDDLKNYPHLLQPLTAYRRQYFAFRDENGDHQIWIFFFGSSFGVDWKHVAMVVDDGGGLFFHIRLNWTKKKFLELQPNGSAWIAPLFRQSLTDRSFEIPRTSIVRSL